MGKRIGRMAMFGICAFGVMAGPLLAATAADLVKTRVTGYRELGAAFKNVNDELKSGSSQIYILQLSARQIRDAAKAQYGWFPAGSGPQPGIKTAAKPEIWMKPADFKTAQDALATQAAAFMTVVASGDLAKIRAQVKPLGQACSGCHRGFRVDDKH